MATTKKPAHAAPAKKVTRKPNPELENETRAEKFKRLAGKRVGVALDKIALIGNLSGSGYEYTQEQAEKITSALVDAVKAVAIRFQPRPARKEGEKRQPTVFEV